MDSRFVAWLAANGLTMLGSDATVTRDDLQYIVTRLRRERSIPNAGCGPGLGLSLKLEPPNLWSSLASEPADEATRLSS
jgi:hypothetical protein